LGKEVGQFMQYEFNWLGQILMLWHAEEKLYLCFQ
jgi:hypothetical protein